MLTEQEREKNRYRVEKRGRVRICERENGKCKRAFTRGAWRMNCEMIHAKCTHTQAKKKKKIETRNKTEQFNAM